MACRYQTLRSAAALAVIASPALAGPELIGWPTALIREGDVSPGGFPVETVAAVRAVEFNTVGGWGALITSRIALSNDYRHEVYGSPASGQPLALLRRDATIGEYTQAEFSPRFALADDAGVLYNAHSTHDPTGVEMDTFWLGPTLLGAQFTRVGSFANTYFSEFNDVAITTAGEVIYAATVSPGPMAPPFNQMLLRGPDAQLVFFGTDPVSGLGESAALGPDIFGDRIAVSPSGEHWLTAVRLAGPVPREALVHNAAAVAIDGVPIVEDEPIPQDLGFDGQRWGAAISYDINDAGQRILAGRSRTGVDTTLETFPFLATADALLFQAGDATLEPGSQTIITNFGAVELNAQGDYACAVTAADPPDYLMFHAVLLNGELVIRAGEPIDWDGDATPEAGYIQLAPLDPADTVIELSDRDASDVVRLGMVADTTLGRALVMADIQLEHVYPPCPADLADPPDHELDFSDVLAFLTLFDAADPRADLAPPMGDFDFSDVLAFMVAFAAGCPF